VPVERIWKDRSLVNIGPQLKGYPEGELQVVPSTELQRVRSTSLKSVKKTYQPRIALELLADTFSIVDLGTNLTGFIGASVQCSEPAKLYFTFDEIFTRDDVDFKRLGCVNALCYELEPGTYRLESLEPYTMRYLKLNVLQGACKIEGLYLREYANSETEEARFSCSDPRINRIFEAARQTFRQNAIDIFMDCPSRERAGWLCDSFFTSRVAFDFCGNTTIEKNLFENYLLPAGFAHLPEGMLPMCYPADHYDGVFIPNWALWFVLQLEEYEARSGDRDLVAALRPRLAALHQYFQKFTNEDGLLEKLDSWVFVEWSKANSFVQDVSYPTNMLYAAALAAGGRLYDEPDLVAQAERIRAVVRRQSFDGEFFVDNAVRRDGRLEVTRNRTEVCQYFAFFFDVATPKTHAALWDKLVHQFGPQRQQTNDFPEIHPANAFVGNYLRSELLSRHHHQAQIKKELIDFYLYMAEQTGTLWENVSAAASCNHGFASHVAHSLYRDVLGVSAVDMREKVIRLRIADVGLDWCEGRLLTPQGPIAVRWWKDDGQTLCRAEVPAGYVVKVENLTGGDLTLQ
jgi:alpha-L-rhamnosidase